MRPETDPFEPTQFGRYYLEQRLAVGGMAEIFRATAHGAHGFTKTLVIKRILPQLGEDKEFVQMFIDEARVMTKLSHPKIVQVHDFGEVEGRYYIAMEYVDGMDLLELLRTCAKRRVRPTTSIAVHVLAEVLDALEYAHKLRSEDGRRLGIVHSDVSPSNIFISTQGEVKLGDFGIARVHGSSGRTESGGLRGKYGYMSPEQVSGSPLDGRADVFAAGIVLAELLMIRRLFIAKNDLEVLLQVRDARLDRLYKYGKRIPPDLMIVLESALARESDFRYQNAGIFRDALHRYLFDNRRMVRASDVRRFLERLKDPASSVHERLEPWSVAVPGRGAMNIGPPLEEPFVPLVSEVKPLRELESDQTTPPVEGSRTLEAPEEVQKALLQQSREHDSESLTPPVEHGGLDDLARSPSVVGKKRRIQLGPPPIPKPVPQGLPQTGEEPRLPTDHALAAAPELAGPGMSPNRDFPTHDSHERVRAPGVEDLGTPVEPESVAAARLTTPIAGVPAMRSPDMKGDLARKGPFQLLFRLAVAEDTGLLVLRDGDAVKEIYLVDGHPHYVTSNQAEELFGQYLVRRGALSAGELSMALAMLPHFDGRLGDTLVALKLMRPMQVLRHLTHQVREKLLEAFGWSTGTYLYYRNTECAHESAPLGLDAYELLGAGVGRVPRPQVTKRLEGMLGAKLQAVAPPPVPPEVFRLGGQARQICEKLNGSHTLREHLDLYDDPAQREAFERMVFLLLETGLAA